MKTSLVARYMVFSLVGLVAVSILSTAYAIPAVGSSRPDVKLDDPWGRSTTLSRFQGKPILVVYEDKDSATLNQPLKDALSKLAKGDVYKKTVALVAVADVGGYDYWPVRGFVKDAIQKESNKQGTIIYCDWDGRVRNTLSLQKGTSNIVLFGKNGKVLFADSGALSSKRREELITLLRREVEG